MAIMHSQHKKSGAVRIDERTCRHCGQCAKICPAEVLIMDNGRLRISAESPFGCIACGHCMMTCPNGSVTVTGRGLAPQDIVPLPLVEQRATADALAALMLSRRSVRHFTSQEVDPTILKRIVEMAASAPMGIPPWDVGCVTVCGRTRVQSLALNIIRGYEGFLKICKPWVLFAMRYFMRRETYEKFRYFILPLAQQYVNAHRNGEDRLFYNAPAVMLFSHSAYAEAVDAGIVCTYAMLAAESFGLGSTIIGGAPPILQRNKHLCSSLGFPDGHTPSFALIVGHPDVEFKRAVRRRFLFNTMR
jgi:nitroreductase/NAD-dependent dihydropyrimidine dehydrogenase PreA subunit